MAGDANRSPPFRIFPSVHKNELSERNKKRNRCNFSQFVPKKIRRRESTVEVATSTGLQVQDEFACSSNQALQPRPISDSLLVTFTSLHLYILHI